MKKVFVAIAAAVALALSASPASAEQRMYLDALITSETTREVDVANDGFGLGDYIELSVSLAVLSSERSVGRTATLTGRMTLLSPTTAHIEAVVKLRNGELIVSGNFNPNAGSPQGLRVRWLRGLYREMSGDLRVFESTDGTRLSFSLKAR